MVAWGWGLDAARRLLYTRARLQMFMCNPAQNPTPKRPEPSATKPNHTKAHQNRPLLPLPAGPAFTYVARVTHGARKITHRKRPHTRHASCALIDRKSKRKKLDFFPALLLRAKATKISKQRHIICNHWPYRRLRRPYFSRSASRSVVLRA